MREWKIADNGAIAALERECFDDPWSEEMLDSGVNAKNFFGLVEEADGKVVGYIGSISDQWDAEILLVAVKGEYRKRGIAKRLMTAVIERYKEGGKENVYLEVRKSNTAAQNLYFGLGFSQIAIREKYYGNTEDALVLKLSLKG